MPIANVNGTELNYRLEGDGPEIASVEAFLDGGPTGRSVCRAERLDAAPSVALGEKRVVVRKAAGQGLDQRRGDERHVPRNNNHRSRALDDRRIDPAQGAAARPHIDGHPQFGAPGCGVPGVGYQQWQLTQGRDKGIDEMVEDPPSSDNLQPLGFSTITGSAATR